MECVVLPLVFSCSLLAILRDPGDREPSHSCRNGNMLLILGDRAVRCTTKFLGAGRLLHYLSVTSRVDVFSDLVKQQFAHQLAKFACIVGRHFL